MKTLKPLKEQMHKPDPVEMDSMDSFPCSDPPGWITTIAHTPCEESLKQ